MSPDAIVELAKILGVGAGVALVLAACAVAAVKTLRSDKRIDSLVNTMQAALDDANTERDYWRGQAEQDRAAMEARFERRLRDRQREEAAARERLYNEIETLRRELHAYTLKGK